MKTLLTVLMITLVSLQATAVDRKKLIEEVKAMSNDAVWDALLLRDQQGRTRFGFCGVWFNYQQAYFGSSSEFYVEDNVVKWRGRRPGPASGTLGYSGWPKNPESGDSTGIIGAGCYPGYKPSMCTPDNKANAKAMLLDALENEELVVRGITYTDVCDLKNQSDKPFKGVARLGPWGGESNEIRTPPPAKEKDDFSDEDVEIKAVTLTGKVIGLTDEGQKVLFTDLRANPKSIPTAQMQKVKKLIDSGLVVLLKNSCEPPAKGAKVRITIQYLKQLRELEKGIFSRYKCGP